MPYDLTVTILDEADPALAIVTQGPAMTPVVVRDYRGIYDRPATNLSRRDFAEWVVIEECKVDSADIVGSVELEHRFDADQEFLSFVVVTVK